MKKLILNAAIMFCAALSVTAQDASPHIFRPFKGDLSFGLIVPTGSGISAGVGIAMEPKYTFFDKLVVGARLDANFTYRDSYFDANGNSDSRLKSCVSYLGTVEYLFTNTKMRPFIGGGVGLYTFYSSNLDSYNGSSNDVNDNKLGGLIRGGFEVGHFRLGLEYNIVPQTNYKEQVYDYNSGNYITTPATINNSYIALKIGAFFGGGRLERLKKKHRRDD